MRYFEIQMDMPTRASTNLVICTLNDLAAADNLMQVLRACTRTYQSLMGEATELTVKDRPYFHVEEDLNHDDDCGAFRLESEALKDVISQPLARILDHEIDLYIERNDLWSDRASKVCQQAKITKVSFRC